MNTYEKQELIDAKFDTLTMKDLRKFVAKNPQIKDNTKVLVERIEDVYFEGKEWNNKQIDGWKVFLVEGYNYWNTSDFNEKMREEIKNREIEKGKYSKKLNPQEAIVELTDDLKEQFHPASCITKDNNEDFVYIYNHY